VTAASSSARRLARLDLPLRLVAAAGGGYALCWAMFVALGAWLPFSKATVWYFTGQIAPLPFLGALLWAFVAHTPQRALAWPFGLAVLCTGIAFTGIWR